MKNDAQISNEAHYDHIQNVADKLDLKNEDIEMYGTRKAKISLDVLERPTKGKLILVTAINPTPAGEGKTTMNIGLAMAMNKRGYQTISALREPSLGPVFGMKGGATGGGYSQVIPMDEINLHFTGDFHAITSAHNLLAAMLDNHIFHGNQRNIDLQSILWGRAMDMNDRALRRLTINSKKMNHDTFFDITAASEIMAIVCLAENLADLRVRLGRIIVAYDIFGNPVVANDLGAVGAMVLLLKDAMKPNLVQTLENTPAIIHGGPFANIAHGCNSIIATKTALKLGDYVVAEAGFGADLGAEKFYDIKCRSGNLKPSATVLVATIRALKYNGGVSVSDLGQENLDALKLGSQNLIQHFENLKKYQNNVIIAINRFASDTDAEIAYLQDLGRDLKTQVILADVFSKGGDGALELAEAVHDLCEQPDTFKLLYENTSIKESIETVATGIYRAASVHYSFEADAKIEAISKHYPKGLPVCIAKTQYSFSDDPKALNVPQNFSIEVRDVRLSQGAGFLVVLLGKIMTMPGMPTSPNALGMDYDGAVIGLI
ncbi:formate--tetrahydrofolate ligase [Erysipelothrix sp. HDW6C]|uniref:formate--tetrahydrofolate ligase n=1 Tax=Erysipelothrix sp. HDW6C TaxID=2714930 RepID=UPI001408E82E|nr:formate--tetrahydrofolate ligase [Erysipelothrix sp. HDW6C]QIK69722.1 formate--tetrahydrofolate ligase [Erysipelothrix sp. HDW6C]